MFLTTLEVADNSGARLVQCIKILGGSNRTSASIGDILIVVVKRVTENKFKITRGRICRAVLVRMKTSYFRSNGVWVRFNDNAVVLVNRRNAPYARRLKGPMLKETCIKYNFLGTLSQFVI